MFESKSFNLAQPKRQDGWVSFQAWTRKWNRFFATIFCVLSFLLLFAIVVVNVVETEHDDVEKEHLDSLKEYDIRMDVSVHAGNLEVGGWKIKRGGCVAIGGGFIVCEGLTIGDVDQELREFIQPGKCTQVGLQLFNINFPIGIFPRNWLSIEGCSITSLYIVDSPTLNLIDGGAFESRSFRDMIDLHLLNTSLEELGTDVLKGLTRLTWFEIDELHYLRYVSADFLAPVNKSLKTLTVRDTSLENPVNLTGSQTMNALEFINFKLNDLIVSLDDNTFKYLPHLTSLNLSCNGIQTMTSNVFDNIAGTIKFIDLRDNHLVTLPEGIFSLIRSSIFRILLDKNPWRCNCSLVELKSYLMDPVMGEWFDSDPLRCDSPFLFRHMKIVEAPFCFTWTTTTTLPASTTIIPPEPTTIQPETTEDATQTTIKATAEPIECVICVDMYEEVNCTYHETRKLAHYFHEQDRSITVRKQTLQFRVEQNEDGIVQIIVQNPTGIKYVIFWFSEGENVRESVQNYVTNEKLCAECSVLSENQYKIPNLKLDFLYIFCLMKYNSMEISPFDCLPYKTRMLPDTVDWIMGQDKIIAYTISILSLLLCSFVGAFIMYCIIRKMPTLLKGSERVIIVKDKEIIVMPNGQKKLSKVGSCQSGNTDITQTCPIENDYSAYLTPIPNLKATYRKIHQRCASDSSLNSIRSYISTKAPQGIQVNRLTCYSDFQGRCWMDLKDVPNTPPPLPQRRSIETEEPVVDYASISKTPDANIYTPFNYGTTIAVKCEVKSVGEMQEKV